MKYRQKGRINCFCPKLFFSKWPVLIIPEDLTAIFLRIFVSKQSKNQCSSELLAARMHARLTDKVRERRLGRLLRRRLVDAESEAREGEPAAIYRSGHSDDGSHRVKKFLGGYLISRYCGRRCRGRRRTAS